MIRSMQTNRLTINDVNMMTKTPNNNSRLIMNKINDNNLYWFNCSIGGSVNWFKI